MSESKYASRQQSIGKEKALALVDARWWESKNFRERAEFQFLTKELCMPFDLFHEAVEKTLGRSVWTHEFGMNFDGLWEELFHGTEPSSLEEIMQQLPLEKTIVVVAANEQNANE